MSKPVQIYFLVAIFFKVAFPNCQAMALDVKQRNMALLVHEDLLSGNDATGQCVFATGCQTWDNPEPVCCQSVLLQSDLHNWLANS